MFEEFSSRENVSVPTTSKDIADVSQIFNTRRVDVLFARGVLAKKRQILKVIKIVSLRVIAS